MKRTKEQVKVTATRESTYLRRNPDIILALLNLSVEMFEIEAFDIGIDLFINFTHKCFHLTRISIFDKIFVKRERKKFEYI